MLKEIMPNRPNWPSIVKTYADSLTRANPKTVRRYKYILNQYLIFCQSNVSRQSILQFKSYLIERKKPFTVNFFIHRLKHFFKWTKKNSYLQGDPSTEIKYVHFEPKPKVLLSENEIEKLSKIFTTTKDSQAAIMFELIYGTGIRCSELRQLTIGDVDFKNKVIKISFGTNKRTVAVPNQIFSNLKKHTVRIQMLYQGSQHIFLSLHGKMIDLREIYRQISKVLILVLGEKKGSNTLRHSFINIMVSRGAPVASIKKQLGVRALTSITRHVSGTPAIITTL
jgi:site-specific recombinase XerD